MKQWPCKHHSMSHYSACCECEYEMLEEIERLRAVLKDIAESGMPGCDAQYVAQEALRSTSAQKP